MDNVGIYGELIDNDFKRLGEFIYTNYGINLYPNKKVLVKSRLQKRLFELGIKSYAEYCDLVLNNDPNHKEAVEMINRISTNKTDFFREANHFDFLSGDSLNKYLSLTGKNKITLWSAGCSSGEEPYTIAMVLNEQKQKIPLFDFEIYASDISTTVLKKAKNAIYPDTAIVQIPMQYRTKYLLKSKDKSKKQIRIAPAIREKIKLFRYNLLSDKPPINKTFDIIFCRNTLIYFDRQTQEKVVANIISILNKGGYLYLGHSESLINMNFALESAGTSIYRKI